jgi:hypothetical protein
LIAAVVAMVPRRLGSWLKAGEEAANVKALAAVTSVRAEAQDEKEQVLQLK